MWILKGPKGEEHYLTTNKVHLVSRKDHGDIVLADDESVSRTHAKIEVSFDGEHVGVPACLPKVILVESKSKYGTYVNKGISTDSRLPEGTRLELNDGDRLRFGIQHSEWKLQHVPLIVTTSTLNPDQKAKLSEKIIELGGHVVPDWQDDCTHVTMNKITLTVKVVCALARGRQIVTPEYWEHYLSAATSKSKLPDYTGYIPPLAERSLSASNVSFTVDKRRATLFKGKLFVFHSVEQHNAFSCMVFAAGGMCVIADGCGMGIDEMLEPHVVVMGYPFERGSQETQFTDSFKQLKSFLISKGKRLISESEIGLAVLHCSIQRYCNPLFLPNGSATTSQSQAALSRRSVVKATEEASEQQEKPQDTESSQDSFPSLRTKRRNRVGALIVESDSESSCPEPEIVPHTASKEVEKDTIRETNESGGISSRKRLRSVVDDVENPSKKIAAGTSTSKQMQAVKACGINSSEVANIVHNNLPEASSFSPASVDKKVPPAQSRGGQNESDISHSSRRAKPASRRISESSDEEEPLFSFVDDPRKPAPKQRTDSGFEKRAIFTFVDEAATNHAASKKRTVRKDSDSDSCDDDAASKFAFVEDPSTKSAETYSPDKLFTSIKRPIQEVDVHDDLVEERPSKRPSVETSMKTRSRIINLEDFISTVKIKDEDNDSSSYFEGLPDYVQAMNNTVIVTVGAVVISRKAEEDGLVSGEKTEPLKNFKKFRKVNSVRKNIAPTIIGGRDLVAINSNSLHHVVNGGAEEEVDRLESTFHFVDD